jgi:hypothetical protein
MPGHPLAKRGAPHWPPYRPSDAPSGPMATASLTGHLLATYWPSREASHWPKGEAPTGHRTGEPMATRELQPPTSRPPMAKGEPHHPLATKGRGGGLCPASPPGGGGH